MQVVTLEISDDYYDEFLYLVDALPANKVSLKKRKSSMNNEIDGRIDNYLKDKFIAVDFSLSSSSHQSFINRLNVHSRMEYSMHDN